MSMAAQRDPSVKQLADEARTLPPEKIGEVLDFVRFLKGQHKTQIDAAKEPQRGSAAAILLSAGTWKFEPEEREALERYLDETRELSDGRF